MSYAIIRVEKFKESDVKGIQMHNQRERIDFKHPDIDREKRALYYDLLNFKPISYDHRVKEIIENGYSRTSKIRKNAAMIVETLVTSDKEFFSRLNFIKQKKFFQDAYDYLKVRYGEKNIVAAVVHLDEKKAPHMHVISVPITEDGRLSARSVFNLKALIELQDALPKFLRDKGFDIKKGGLRNGITSIETSENQTIKDLENEISILKNENSALQNKIISLQNDLKVTLGELSRLDRVM